MPDLDRMEAIVSLAKQRGFIFPSAEIYGGFRSTYDYGPLGALMLRNVRNAWWNFMVQQRTNVVGIEAAILSSPKIWEASGHLAGFTDPLVDCRKCGSRWREDQIEGVCPNCGSSDLTESRDFNLMFKTFVGPLADDASVAYLRPETAQGMFVNFPLVQRALRLKPPFGIAQLGKSFRNEITPGNFVFRTREFDQMEMEFFTPPELADRYFDYWVNERYQWYRTLGIPADELRLRPHEADELSHYSKGTIDVEYLFPWGFGELEGIANRGTYDLNAHATHSGEDMSYFDPQTNERYLPNVIEPAGGVTRAMMAFLLSAYDRDEVGGEERTVLRLSIENVALASITEVDTPYWFYTNPELPTVREVIEHTKLIHEADLTYSILLSIDGEVMDGMHRVAKAILEGSTTIKAIRLPALGEPDYRNCLPGELQY